MNCKQSILSAAIVASLGFAAQLHAQEADSGDQAKKEKVTDIEKVTVVGIRGSLEASLDAKRDADSHVEVVNAEDIGKLPAKNVADTLQRLPGVNISSSSATEGGFDEADRVSLRGTSPSLTQTLINGHTVGTGDWFVLSQVQTVGRSVSYTLLPSEIVSKVVVHKSSEAKITEGGSAGSVDIITRRPLQFPDAFTGEANVGAVYSDLPGDTKPQFDALLNWKNDANTAGILFQAFYEKRSLRRDGQEVVGGYLPIAAGAPVTTSNPDLAGVLYPNLIGSTLFEQTRERKGGVLDIQIKPTDNLTLGLNAFYSKLEADNYNRNYMLWNSQYVPTTAPLPGYTIANGVLTHADYAATTGAPVVPHGVYDMISRQGASSDSKYIALDADWQVTDRFDLKFQAGDTEGHGRSPSQDVLELGFGGNAESGWTMRGTSSPINWHIGGDNASPSGIIPTAGWIFGDQDINVLDKEKWGQADGELYFADGALNTLDFGARYTDHTRDNGSDIGQGPAGDWQNLANYPTSFNNYPGDYGSGIGGDIPTGIWYYSPGDLADFDSKFTNRDPVARFNWQNIYKVQEKTGAAYAQANFSGDRWSGNLGVRYVRTEQSVNYNTSSIEDNTVEGPVTGSAFGAYYKNAHDHTYSEFLPSANVKFSLTDDLVLRFGASKTLTRPDFSALAGYVSLDDLTHTGSGGNPDLDPIVSTNLDASLEWYFAPRALLSASIYSMRLKDYVTFGNETRTYVDQAATNNPVTNPSGAEITADYLVSVPVNTDARVKGIELAYEQPIGENFGVAANYTYADSDSDGAKPVYGTSKNTYNLSGYFENDMFNARLSYTYRSAFYAGVSRTDDFFQDSIGTLSASFGYKINDRMSITLDALNLNDPKLKYYSRTANQNLPYAFYSNGRQYYANFHFKF